MSSQSSYEGFESFGLTKLAVKNHKTVFLLIALVIFGGIYSYTHMTREAFPEVEIPTIMVTVPYPGNSPEIIKDKIILPFEKKLNKLRDIKKIESTAQQDLAMVMIEFEVDVDPDEAKKRVEDALDEARSEKSFAQDLPVEPTIMRMDINEMPVIHVNLSGHYPKSYLKTLAERIKDDLEGLPEISEVQIRGVQDQKLKIQIRRYDAEDKGVSFGDIERTLRNENLTIGAGNVTIDGINHFVIVDGKLRRPEEIAQLIVKHERGKNIYLWEVADVEFGDVDTTSYARQMGEPVVMLDIKKRSGANIIRTIDKVKEYIRNQRGNGIPEDISISYTNDLSKAIRSQLHNLENSIISGMILVIGVLMLFLGLRNALYVGLAIPMSMFISFILLYVSGITLNMMVLFSLVMALGMLVDNAIVVVENIYRLVDKYKMPRKEASIYGVGEVAIPIMASTVTTLAAFLPLMFWPGIMGEFMFYLPLTLMIVLGASLFVAVVINPTLTAYTMKIEEQMPDTVRMWKRVIGLVLIGLALRMMGWRMLGHFLWFVALGWILWVYVFSRISMRLRTRWMPALERLYRHFIQKTLRGYRPLWMTLGTFGLLFVAIGLFVSFPPRVLFLPNVEPNFFTVYIEHPEGTDIRKTDETSKAVYGIIREVLHRHGWDTVRYLRRDADGVVIDTIPLVSTIIEQVGKGISDDVRRPSFGETPHKALITVSFCEFEYRKGHSTFDIMKAVEDTLLQWPYADVNIYVIKEPFGPPQERPVQIELSGGEDYLTLVRTAEELIHFLDKHPVPGVQKMRAEVGLSKPEIRIHLNRTFLQSLDMSTGQVASTIRTALFGKDVSMYERGEDSYDINLRFAKNYREDLEDVLNHRVMFMNKRGQHISVPIAAVVDSVETRYTYSALKRLDLVNTVRLYSEVEAGYNENEVIDRVRERVREFEETPAGVKMRDHGIQYKFTGKLKQQREEMGFLSMALFIAVALILLILVTQFNSYFTPLIVMSSVLLSMIGVLLGLIAFGDEFVVVMTMIGIISLAGIVVNNAIVLIDYTNLLRRRRKAELHIAPHELLPIREIKNTIIEGGATRLRPVLLTAITTVLGLLPLALGVNIDFFDLLESGNPHFYVGGESSAFFGPMSWAIIYGLSFSTFLTLVIVPSMYYLAVRAKLVIYRWMGWQLPEDM